MSISCAPRGRGTQKARRRRQEGAGQRTEAAPMYRTGVTQVCKAHSVPRTDTKKSALNHAESRSETRGKEKTFELPGKRTHDGQEGRNHREVHTETSRRPRARSKQSPDKPELGQGRGTPGPSDAAHGEFRNVAVPAGASLAVSRPHIACPRPSALTKHLHTTWGGRTERVHHSGGNLCAAARPRVGRRDRDNGAWSQRPTTS